MVVAESDDAVSAMFERVRRLRVASFLGRGHRFSEAELDQLVASPQGRQIAGMMRHTAVGTPAVVRTQLDEFARHADADELIVVHNATSIEDRLRSVHLVADAYESATVAP